MLTRTQSGADTGSRKEDRMKMHFLSKNQKVIFNNHIRKDVSELYTEQEVYVSLSEIKGILNIKPLKNWRTKEHLIQKQVAKWGCPSTISKLFLEYRWLKQTHTHTQKPPLIQIIL